MPDEQTNEAFVDAVRRIQSACEEIAGLYSVGGFPLDDRCLIVKVLMRSVGITLFLAGPVMDYSQAYTDALRFKIHEAFGAPGDWGYESPLGSALADLYQA